MKKVVIVDDDKEIAELLSVYIKNEDFDVKTFYDGTSALEYLKCNNPDILLLDIMIPDIGGFEILAEIRKEKYYPVIFISAKDNSYDILNGLTLGGDDYIKKPFNPLEVIARIKAIFRMKNEYKKSENILKYKELLIDYNKRKVSIQDRLVDLTETEFKVLELLTQNLGKPLETEKIFRIITGDDYYNKGCNSIATHIRNIRLKLGDSFDDPKYIKTKWGQGYVIEDYN